MELDNCTNKKMLSGMMVFMVLFFVLPSEKLQAMQEEVAAYRLTSIDLQKKFYKAQIEKKINVNIVNEELQAALREIADKAGLKLTYRGDIISDKKVTLQTEGISVTDALYLILNGTGLEHLVSEKGYLLISEEIEVDEIYQEVVQGRVTDASSGETLPGVNIAIKGTNQGATTNMNGFFELEVSSLQDTLIVSFIGYNTQEVPLNMRTELNIEMVSQILLGDEIVVTAVGTRRFRDQDGSASSQVGAEDIIRSRETGLINSLAGKASGVRIGKSNGDPGAGSVIQIRGANTIQGASQPLIILDGVPVSNENIGSGNFSQQSRLNDINPNDVESVQILKGASAAALWGSRAANGVIVITTKSGAPAQRPSVQYSVTHSFDHINVKTPMQDQFGQGRNGVWNTNFAESWGDKIADRSGGPDVVDQNGAYFISDVSGERYYPVLSKNSRETFVNSNYDLVFQTGTYTEHDISVSGGGDRGSYFFSLGNLNQEGIIRNYTYDRQNLRLNNRFQITDWLVWDNKVSFTSSNSDRIHQAGNTTNGIMLGLLRTAPDFDIRDYKGTYVSAGGEVIPGRQRSYRMHLGEALNPVYNNPLWTLDEQTGATEVKRFIITPQLQIDPLDWLNVIVRGGIDYYNDSREEFYPVGSASGPRSGGLWEQFDITSREINVDAMVNIERDLNQHINLTATLGANLNDRERTTNVNSISPFAVDSRQSSVALNPDQASSSWNRNLMRIRSNRGYGILAFNLYDQFFVNVTGTMEAASTIRGNFFYPSVDVAWQFSDLIPSDVLSFGKLRASWGKVGTQPAPYRFSTLASTGFSTFGGSFTVDNVRGNPDLKPEIKTEWEIGTDLRFLRNRIELGATYYQNRTSDILFAVRTTPSTGYSFNYTNAATTENKGVELDLRTRIVQARDLQVSLNSNFNNNRNMVVDISGAETVDIGGTSRAVQGHAMSAFHLPGTRRDDNGDLILDANGFPQLDTNRRVIGNPNPKWRGGMGMDFDWKGFDFSFLFEHSRGGDFINRTRIVLYGFGVHEDVGHEVTLTEDLVNVAGQTFTAGTTVRGNIEDFGGGNVLLDEAWYNGIGGGLGFNKVNDLYVEDATWTKLRHVTLGYTFSNLNVFQGINIQSLRFSVTGRDLFLWSGLNGVDPETNNYGVSNAFGMNYFNNPGTRSVTFNFQVNL